MLRLHPSSLILDPRTDRLDNLLRPLPILQLDYTSDLSLERIIDFIVGHTFSAGDDLAPAIDPRVLHRRRDPQIPVRGGDAQKSERRIVRSVELGVGEVFPAIGQESAELCDDGLLDEVQRRRRVTWAAQRGERLCAIVHLQDLVV